MKPQHFLVALAVLALAFLAPTAGADCFKCDVNDCCAEAASNTSGLTQCSNSVVCLNGYGCACYNCSRNGYACAGSGPAECTNENGVCEEHQSSTSVPNGQPAPAELLKDPGTLDLSGWGAQPGTCGVS